MKEKTMLHTVVIKNRKASIAPYFRGNTMGSKAVYNTANFLIRNVMTAVSKDSDKWTDNEREVMERVETARCAYNAFRKTHALSKGKKVPEPMEAPCKGRWMLSYGFLDFLLKTEKNEAYYSCTSQVNQQAIRKVIRAWKSYFALLKKHKADPASLKERPKSPLNTPKSHSPYLTKNGFKSPSLSCSACKISLVTTTPWDVSLFSAGSPGAIYISRNTKRLKSRSRMIRPAIFAIVFLITAYPFQH